MCRWLCYPGCLGLKCYDRYKVPRWLETLRLIHAPMIISSMPDTLRVSGIRVRGEAGVLIELPGSGGWSFINERFG